MKVPLFDGSREFEADRAELLRAAEEVLSSGRYILGEPVRRFEQEVERYLGGGHAVGVASGTDALILALKACGVGPGDWVLTTPFSFMATASAIVNVGAEPVFADIEPDTLNLDPERVREMLERRSPLLKRLAIDPGRIKAMVPVHLFGLPVDLDAFLELGQYFGVRVIQDAAQAFGSRYRGRVIGTDPDMTTLSFFPTKNLGGFGDGGMVATPSEEVAEHLRLLRSHGATGKYVHDVIGTNSRLDALQAALLSVRLAGIEAALAARERVAAAYDRELADLPDMRLPVRAPFPERTFHQYVVRIGRGRRDEVRAALADVGVESAVHYPVPLHRQAALASLGYREGDLPKAEQASREVLSLPIFPTMREDEVVAVTSALIGEPARRGDQVDLTKPTTTGVGRT